jgi:hypothetical protein
MRQSLSNIRHNFTLRDVELLNRPLIFLLCLAAFCAEAQTKRRNFRQRELGFFGGGSYYIGDINTRTHILPSRPAAGVFFRYSTNYRYAWRFGVARGTIGASDAASGEPDQVERNLNFRTDITEAHAIAEFNFVEYRIGHDRHRFTFFIFGGIAGFYFDPKGDLGNGYVPLREHQTEGESNTYSRLQVSVPFGVGVKWNLGEKAGLGIEWGPRRTFTDYLDDVSGAYPELVTNGGGFTDRTLNGSAVPGGMRGNPTTKDWYFYCGITLSLKLPDPRRACHTSN